MLPSLKNNLTIIFRCEKTWPRTSTRKFSCKWRPKPEIWKRKMSNKLRRGPELNFHYSFRLGQRLTENLAIFLFVVLRSGRVCFVARHRFCKKKTMIPRSNNLFKLGTTSNGLFCPDVMCRFYLLKLAAHLKSQNKLIINFVSLPKKLNFQDFPNADLCPTPWGLRWCSSPTGSTTRTTGCTGGNYLSFIISQIHQL